MKVTETLRRIVRHLNAAGIPHMITGSLGCMVHGEPRSTNDVDIVVDPDRKSLSRFLGSVESEFFLSPDVAWRAFEIRSLFNLVDRQTGEKVDLIIRKNRTFSQTEFSRRKGVNLEGETISIVSPEDAILSKLEWAKKGESERQFRDALGIAITQRGRLDRAYMETWAAELGVADDLKHLIEKADRLGVE